MTKRSLSLRTCLLHVVLDISYLILFFLIFKILFLPLFFLSAELNIFEKDQQFKDYLRDYETLHCGHYVAYHGVSRNERVQGEWYAWFNTRISHCNSITLLYLFHSLWLYGEERRNLKPKFQIMFELGICFTTTTLLFVSLERPLI